MENVAKRIVYAPAVLWLDLELHLFETGRNVGPDAFAFDLIERWLVADKARLAQESEGRPLPGYQWKDVFLPDGTVLRTSSNGVNRYAQVKGAHILSDDRNVSPSQFANATTERRSAWRSVWLRFPGQEHWERAVDFRGRQARKLAKSLG